MSHTYALLDVSPSSYEEIKAKLLEAGYSHAINDRGEIDMHGLALVKGESEMGLDTETTRGIVKIARACHEVNRAYCEAMGDHSQPAWEEAPEWQKESAMKGVMLHLDNPNAGPEQSHESWFAQKVADGWIYGQVKDPAKKEHPCMVPFNELPTHQQAKDFIFRAVVHAMAQETAA